jgi:hypothetical protein
MEPEAADKAIISREHDLPGMGLSSIGRGPHSGVAGKIVEILKAKE